MFGFSLVKIPARRLNKIDTRLNLLTSTIENNQKTIQNLLTSMQIHMMTDHPKSPDLGA